MSPTNQSAWRRRIAAVVCCVIVLVVAVAATAGASPRGASAVVAPRCTAAHVQVWLGLGVGGGTAGSTYYPLEFSNVGRRACSLNGFPGVSAVGDGGHQIGPSARRNGQHHASVTLAPRATAHSILRVEDWGALCSHEVRAAALKVFPPGARRSESVPFSFGACARRSVLVVGPVRAGVGIPGFTTS